MKLIKYEKQGNSRNITFLEFIKISYKIKSVYLGVIIKDLDVNNFINR